MPCKISVLRLSREGLGEPGHPSTFPLGKLMAAYLGWVALAAPPPALGLSQVLSSVTGQEADRLTGGCPGLVPG